MTFSEKDLHNHDNDIYIYDHMPTDSDRFIQFSLTSIIALFLVLNIFF